MPTTRFISLNRRNAIISALTLGVVLVIISSWLWWHFIFTNPRRVFQDMLETSLRTSSFTKDITQNQGGQKLNQIIEVHTGSSNVAHSRTLLSQSGNAAASVTTESIGTPKDDYIRYLSVKTDQKDKNGNDLDFSPILNLWGKSDSMNDSAPGQLFTDSILSVVPMAPLTAADRNLILEFARSNEIYSPDYETVRRTTQNGRRVFTYKVEIDAEKYIEMLKIFGRTIGFNQLEGVDSTAYHGRPPIQFELSIDVLSRQMTKIKYAGSREEAYGSYGALKKVEIPKGTVSVEELQVRLQSIE